MKGRKPNKKNIYKEKSKSLNKRSKNNFNKEMSNKDIKDMRKMLRLGFYLKIIRSIKIFWKMMRIINGI